MASVRETSFPGCRVFDLNAISLDEPQMEDLRHLAFHRRPAQAAPAASRFLKRDRSVGAKHFIATAPVGQGRGPKLSSGWSPTTTLASNTAVATGSQIRASAVLRKVAQMETKILGRAKAHKMRSDKESDPKIMGKGPPKRVEDEAHGSAGSPLIFQTRALEASVAESPAPDGEGRKFLRTKGPAAEDRALQTPRPRTPWQNELAGRLSSGDSDTDEMQALLGSLAESSREETHSPLGLPSDKVSQREPGKTPSDQIQTQWILPGVQPPRTWSPPASGSAHRAPHDTHSQARSPHTRISRDPAPRTASLSISGALVQSVSSTGLCGQLTSYPGRSAAGRGEEAASDTGDDADDNSLDDFRVNILSLDDLAPAVSENSDWERKVSTAEPSPPLLSPPLPPPPTSFSLVLELEPGPQVCKASSHPELVVPTESESESEVSEHLGSSMCSGRPWSRALTSSLASTAYSGDFEPAPGPSKDTPDGTQHTVSSSAGTALLPRPPSLRRPQARSVGRVTLRETAVQTLDFASTSLWTEGRAPWTQPDECHCPGSCTHPPVFTTAAGVALGGTYVDPAPIAPHVVSADAIEALTAHSPTVVALDDLLRQQLHLTQQFIQASRHLHVSLLRSLDGDTFHYHSLEDAKEYIRCHGPSPLTMQDAVQEAEEP
ncbi:uncharacterized protein C19orf44 homolog [Erethizon dorsatum]